MAQATQTRSPRLVGELPLLCPAGAAIAESLRGSGIRCRIEHSSLFTVGHQRSLRAFCCGDYQSCPTWRAHREAEMAHRDKAMRDENEMTAAAPEIDAA